MEKILLKNAWILTSTGFRKGSLVIEDSKIAHFIWKGGVVSESSFKEIIDADNKIVMPGLINAHCHSYGNLVKGLTPSIPLEGWMLYIIEQGKLLSPEDCYWNAMIGALEMIKSGTTCFIDQLDQPFDGMDAAMQAYRDIGIRCVMAPMVWDKTYFASLDVDENKIPADFLHYDGTDRKSSLLKMIDDLLAKWHDPRGNLQVAFGPSGPQRCSDELLVACTQKAKEYGTIVHTHVLETNGQAKAAQRLYQTEMIKHLKYLGVLNERFSFAHGVHLSDEEISIVAEHGSSLVHNPSVNFLLGSGICPVPQYLRAGVNVALGTDGANGSGNLNMFESIKEAATIHNVSAANWQEPDRWITPLQALEMATKNSAQACGLSKVTGMLQEGMSADLIILNPQLSPKLATVTDVCWQVAYTNPEECVETVFIAGKKIMDQRRLTMLSEERILSEAQKRSQRIKEEFYKAALPKVVSMNEVLNLATQMQSKSR